MSKVRSKLKFIVGLLISAVCIGFLVRTIESEDFLNELRRANTGYLALAVLVTLSSYVLRAARWPFFFARSNLTFFSSYRIVILGFFMNNVLPARMGEVVRAHLGGRATGLSRSTVLASIFGERLADGLAISLIFTILFSIEHHRSGIEHSSALYYVSIAFLAGGVGTLLLLSLKGLIFRLLDKIVAKLPAGKLSQYGAERFKTFVNGLAPMFYPKRAVKVFISSFIIWFVELSVYYFVSRAFAADLSLGNLAYFMAALNFSSLIPGAPGGIGVIEFFTTKALEEIGVRPAAALSMVMVVHVIQYAAVGIPGMIFFFSKAGKADLATGGTSTPIDAQQTHYVNQQNS